MPKNIRRDQLHIGSMIDLSRFEDGQFDLVVLLFGAASYCDSLRTLLEQVTRVLSGREAIRPSVLKDRSGSWRGECY